MFRFVFKASLIFWMMFIPAVFRYQSYCHQIKDKIQRKIVSGRDIELNAEDTISSRNRLEERSISSLRDTTLEVYSHVLREKREIQEEVCSSAASDFKCSDTERSCRDRCGDRVTIENATQFYCHCDELCSHYGDCCRDYGHQCQNCNATERGIIETNQTLVDIGNDSCAPVFVHKTQRANYQCTRVQGVVRVYLKASCHADYKNFALEKKCLSEEEPYSKIPCYDAIKDEHYKNIYCAECNFVEAALSWRLRIKCTDANFLNDLNLRSLNIPRIMEFILDSTNIGHGCRIDYMEPLLENVQQLRPCISTQFECEYCEDTTLAALCHTYGLDPIDNVTVYHNLYCWKCSQKFGRPRFTPYAQLCRLVEFADIPPEPYDDLQTLSFQILMDVTGDTINVRTVADQQNTGIAEVELSCSDDVFQCRLKRCLGNLTRIGDECVVSVSERTGSSTVNPRNSQATVKTVRKSKGAASTMADISPLLMWLLIPTNILM
ncbi:unnamed protein product [Owenia fusiformis]|uniref:SMB domain-containing protein n=1 Tax=Owenia fusiformis TaxID=6347 RepID=A0A8S4Q268_OWEFU|nr:unnamed protein product [Owenia fusiformis]